MAKFILSSGQLTKIIAGGISSTITDLGPLTRDKTGVAAQRISHQVLASVHEFLNVEFSKDEVFKYETDRLNAIIAEKDQKIISQGKSITDLLAMIKAGKSLPSKE